MDGRTWSWGVLPVRLVVGIVFLVHGVQKIVVFGPGGTARFLASLGFPAAPVAAVLLIVVETLGGLALILGLRTRWAAGLLAIDMLVAILTVNLRGGFFVPRGVEFPLTLLGACLSLLLLGAGSVSLDHLIGGRPRARSGRR